MAGTTKKKKKTTPTRSETGKFVKNSAATPPEQGADEKGTVDARRAVESAEETAAQATPQAAPIKAVKGAEAEETAAQATPPAEPIEEDALGVQEPEPTAIEQREENGAQGAGGESTVEPAASEWSQAENGTQGRPQTLVELCMNIPSFRERVIAQLVRKLR